jgi:pimeloyl-ACP methyl ester carboxylesterase
VQRLPECSHWLTHEAPERVAGLIRGFVDEDA